MTTHNVYVVELRRNVLEVKKFADKNPDCEPGMRCYYVGMTGLSPEQRFGNHKRGYKANRFVRDYGIGLRRDEYESYNPMSYEDACFMEVFLAEMLRAKGHAVWQN